MKKILKMVALTFAFALMTTVGLKSNAYANRVMCVCYDNGNFIAWSSTAYICGLYNDASDGGCWAS